MPSHQNKIEINTLIIVCCHAIYLGGPGRASNEANWLIEPFQAGETPTFTQHIEQGVELLAQSQGAAILCFSGGATKRKKIAELKQRDEFSLEREQITEDITEAESYENVALESDLFGYGGVDNVDSANETLRSRIFQERFATDSYQNILLALLQYSHWVEEHYRVVGATTCTAYIKSSPPIDEGDIEAGGNGHHGLKLPKKLIIVSHEFKRARFMKLHLPAIISLLGSADLRSDDRGIFSKEWQSQLENIELEYVGINPPFDEQKMKEIEEGDRKRGYGVWEGDLHGTGELLSNKRIDRGWDARKFMVEARKWYGEAAAKKTEEFVNIDKS